MAKRALVTGACGFTGTHMVELLVKEGWEVVGTDLAREQHKEYYCESGDLVPVYIDDFLDRLGVEFIPADLTDRASLEPLFDRTYDCIFHIASLYDYFALWDALYKVNVEGTTNLAELAVEHKVGRFVHWSTDGVYGEPADPPGDEETPHNPPNPYSKSKSMQEELLWKLHREAGLPLTVVRPAPIYGPRHIYGAYHVLYGIQKIGTGVIVSWFPKKKTLMFPSVHVTDLVRAALFVAEKEEALGEAYNALSDNITQVELMEFLYKALGFDRVLRIPVWWPVYKLCANIAVKIVKKVDARARALGKRPNIDVSMVEYITHQYWFSNDKLKNLGFRYIYQDPRKGLWDYITWCRERGLL